MIYIYIYIYDMLIKLNDYLLVSYLIPKIYIFLYIIFNIYIYNMNLKIIKL